ncbi:xanthine dehydrogenase family protein subunit M [Chryseobacterium aquaticum]|uniref:Xanthine dehydrogenase family protein subunit M n=1 Tax=Chryseobacterium aquaticum TaxID=452084 RepID=A0A848N7H2_9FLAO|nr:MULTISPECIES: xanthine dehydrogenase family protein subunit M [Chryseobacterium]NMR33293.1 xanthine dehydrogenase family protein subunit M [Chryseobacterium aquaticum]NRQ44775.1 xanthine dehydrogenase family protein subunit M [Chryseobacterium sp. C-204]
MNNFSYTKANSVDEAVSLTYANEENKIIAGGTNIIDLMKYFVTEADTLIDINPIDGIAEITELDNGGIRIGALMTNADTAYHPIIEEKYPLLSKAILAGASAQIRNMATNGGNLLQRTRCYYFYDINTPCNKRVPGSGCCAMKGYNRIHAILGHSENCIAVFPSDMCVALASLEAVVHISGTDGDRILKFSDFHRLPEDTPEIDNNLKKGEVITGIELPEKGFSKNYSYLKLRDRSSYSFALVSVATGLELENGIIKEARIALGGVSHKPWRVKEAEDFLAGKEANPENFEAVADIILEGAVGFEHNSFKINLAKKAIVRNCMMALDPASQRPGAKPSL